MEDKNEHIEIVPLKNKAYSMRPVQFITLGFVVIILLGSFLLSTPIANEGFVWRSYIDALFTSTSAICVTGLAVVDTATSFTLFGEIVILFLIQIGGLGFMTLATMLFMLIGKKITLKERIAIAESYNQDDLQGMVRLIRMIMLFTFVIEFVGAFMLSFSFVPIFGWSRGLYYSAFHSISAFCNAGFDLMGVLQPGVGLTAFQTDVICNIGVMMLIFLGGLGFTVIADIVKKRGHLLKFSVHTKVVLLVTSVLFLLGTILFAVFEWNNKSTIGDLNFFEKIMASMFQAVTPRTAGFATVDQGDLTAASKVLTSLYMFIGASSASTGGGVKNTTVVILLLIMLSGIKGGAVTCFGRSIHKRTMVRAVAIIFFALLVIFTSTFIVCYAELNVVKNPNVSIESIIFECVSAFGTVGLSTGITPHLSIASKIVLILVMLIGRLGTIALGLLAFNKKDNLNIKYPDAKFLVG